MLLQASAGQSFIERLPVADSYYCLVLRGVHICLPESDRCVSSGVLEDNALDSLGSLRLFLKRNTANSPKPFPWNANMVAYYQDKLMSGGFICHAAWQEVSASAVAEVLDTIRTYTREHLFQIRSR